MFTKIQNNIISMKIVYCMHSAGFPLRHFFRAKRHAIVKIE